MSKPNRSQWCAAHCAKVRLACNCHERRLLVAIQVLHYRPPHPFLKLHQRPSTTDPVIGWRSKRVVGGFVIKRGSHPRLLSWQRRSTAVPNLRAPWKFGVKQRNSAALAREQRQTSLSFVYPFLLCSRCFTAHKTFVHDVMLIVIDPRGDCKH